MKPNNKSPSKKTSFRIDEIALVVIVLVLALIVGIYEESGKIDAAELTEIILDDHYISFVNRGVVDGRKLDEIMRMDYADLKTELSAKNDFCIYLEDSSGNIIAAKGSSKLKNEVSHCSE